MRFLFQLSFQSFQSHEYEDGLLGIRVHDEASCFCRMVNIR